MSLYYNIGGKKVKVPAKADKDSASRTAFAKSKGWTEPKEPVKAVAAPRTREGDDS